MLEVRVRRLRWWDTGFAVAFALLGLLGGWWTILIRRLVDRNYLLASSIYGASPDLQAEHSRQQWMIFGESGLLLALALALVALAWRQAQAERAQARRLEGMLAASTHELKTPVAAIRSLLETMQSGVLPPERAGPYLARGLESCARLEHLVESVLSYQAAMAGAQAPEPVAAGALVEPVLQHRRETVPGERISYAPGAAAQIPVLAAADAVRVILENLFDNAAKYGDATKPGAAQGVEVEVVAAGAMVEIRVSDRGQGFAPGEAEALFEPYQRGKAGQRRHGTGLGLYLARGLARSAGGDLVAESAGPGRGATFTLRLRRAPDPR